MSTLYVDTINEKTSGNSVQIPGHVVQVVEGEATSDASTTSSTFTATNLSATITPSSSSNKVLAVVHGHIYTPTNNQFACDVFRGSTSITGKTAGFVEGWYESTRGRFPVHCMLLDAPASTSALTYTLYFRSIGGSSISFPNQPASMKATITLMEIAQ